MTRRCCACLPLKGSVDHTHFGKSTDSQNRCFDSRDRDVAPLRWKHQQKGGSHRQRRSGELGIAKGRRRHATKRGRKGRKRDRWRGVPDLLRGKGERVSSAWIGLFALLLHRLDNAELRRRGKAFDSSDAVEGLLHGGGNKEGRRSTWNQMDNLGLKGRTSSSTCE